MKTDQPSNSVQEVDLRPPIQWDFSRARITFVLLLLFQTQVLRPGESAERPSVALERKIKPNRSLPSVKPPPATFEMRGKPTSEDFFHSRVFEEPLVPVGEVPSEMENGELAAALLTYSKRTSLDDFSSITDFLLTHPRSPWAAALLTNLGQDYYNTGHYSLAIDSWSQAWTLSKHASEPRSKGIGDRAIGELAYMYAKLGRMAELERLLTSVENRVFSVPASERISGAREGLATMKERPEVAFRCGPLALRQILLSRKATLAGDPLIMSSASTTNGFSLPAVANLSEKLGLNYQMASRDKGADFVVPSVVHWKVGHYAAIVREQDGRYLLQDPTFQDHIWVSREALSAEASGYFLIPPGPLPTGWRAVNSNEGMKIWGKGMTCCRDRNPQTKCDPHSSGGKSCTQEDEDCKGMAVSSVHLMLVSLNIKDEPVGYSPPVGPAVRFKARYNQKESFQPAAFAYSNLGPAWTFDWLSYIRDNPLDPSADVLCYVAGGGARTFTGFDSLTKSYDYEMYDQTKLTRVGSSRYEMVSRDGSRQIFSQPDGSAGTWRKVFLTQIIDPFGNTVSLTYDSNLRLIGVTDAIGQVTLLAYQHPTDIYKITKVTDPFGRSATFDYDRSGRLINIIDVIGLSSQFEYAGSGTFVKALITPYGTTSFSTGFKGTMSWLETVYPDGERDRVEYNQDINLGIDQSDPPLSVPKGMATVNNYLAFRNTYYWSKIACAMAYGDHTKATIYHWLHTGDFASASGMLESTKEPLEGRVWYDYEGQSSSIVVGSTRRPAHIGRVLDDGSTQLQTFAYNGFGNVTKTIDPVGRTFSFVYATNGIDLLEIRQTRAGNNELLSQTSYSIAHLPLSSTDAAGQTTRFEYNPRGQLLSVRNPRNEVIRYSYDTNAYLTNIDGALPGSADSVTYTYDALGRLASSTDPDGYTKTFAYDLLDRLTRTTYPDGSFDELVYKRLDLVGLKDRAGRLTLREFNAVGQLTKQTDPLNRSVMHQWCSCGDRKSLTDPMGRTTHWRHDVQGRVVEKEYADGSKIAYVYENTTSRLHEMIDEKLQVTRYNYYRDEHLRTVSYANTSVPTPSVSFAYDSDYLRLSTMQDSIGITHFQYYPITQSPDLGAGRLAIVNGPLSNTTITYTYDELGRQASRSINGSISSQAVDPAGRILGVTNALGSFAYEYDAPTPRVLRAFAPSGLQTKFRYQDNLHDRRLAQVTHSVGTTAVSEFTYEHDVRANRITSWLQAVDSLRLSYQFRYDSVDQLISASALQGGGKAKVFAYTYGLDGNLLTEQTDETSRKFFYNALNQLTATEGGISEPQTKYEWDGDHRLMAVETAHSRTTFMYDGFGRRVGIRELVEGTEVAKKNFIWCGDEICEERTSSGEAVRRFFPQGVSVELGPNKGRYYYTKDHLGSIRELVDESGKVRAQYAYDPYGVRSRISGDLEADFGFAGYFFHQQSGLYLTLMRGYDRLNARWLSRDPIEEYHSPNLYQYCANNPVNRIDPLGTISFSVSFWSGVTGGVKALEVGNAVATTYAVGTASALGGFIGAGLAGWTAGQVFNDTFLWFSDNKWPSEIIYDLLNPQENQPAYDPLKDPNPFRLPPPPETIPASPITVHSPLIRMGPLPIGPRRKCKNL